MATLRDHGGVDYLRVDSMARRRIMFVVPSLGGGGAARVVVTLLRHLDATRFEAHLVVVDALWPYVQDVPEHVTLHALDARRVRRALPRLLRVIWRIRPAVVVSTQGYMNSVMLVARRVLPRGKLVVREVIGDQYLQDSRFQDAFYRWYLRAVRRADRIVTQSDAAARDMLARMRARPGQVQRIYNPVDTVRLAREARAGGSPFGGAGPHLLAAGRLHPQKGFDLLLTSFRGVRDLGIAATLTVLGEGAERPALESQARALGLAEAVRFVGFQEHPYPYFGHADLFVLSSRYEGMPNTLLEALACGCPVVAFDCPHGVREIVEPEVNGLLVPPEDVPALTAALARLLGDAAERARLRDRIAPTLERFTAPAITRCWETIFDELTAG
jgi:glycosyltransferase involved in cell wall biosynthesis